MAWLFDQAENAVCIACQSVMAGEPVLVVTHYADDHSWAFMDGQPVTYSEAMVVKMVVVVMKVKNRTIAARTKLSLQRSPRTIIPLMLSS